MQDLTLILADLIEIDGQPMTDSLKVAARFGKEHSKVLRSIRAIQKDQPDFWLANFGETFDEYISGQGAVKKRAVIRMTKDGFTFLSMGFTGKEAAAWKIRYIGAFNAMAAKIAKASRVPAIPLSLHEQALKLTPRPRPPRRWRASTVAACASDVTTSRCLHDRSR